MSSELEELIGGTALPTVDDDGQVPQQPPTVAEPPTEPDDSEEIEVAEADEETPQPAPEPAPESAKAPDAVPLPVYMELKHEVRDLRKELASLRGSREPAPAVQQPVEEPDPVDVYAKAHAEEYGGDPDDVPIPAKVLKQHAAWSKRQQEAQSRRSEADTRVRAVETAKRTLTDEVLGEGLGFETVVNMGWDMLTPGDKLDIEMAGAQCDKELYRRCVARLTASGTPQGRLLTQRLTARLAKAAPAGPSSPPSRDGKQPVVQARPVPTRQEVLGRTTNAELAALGFDGGVESD